MNSISKNEKLIETKTCHHCGESFMITDKDVEFLGRLSPIIAGEKFEIPTPTHCPACRQIRRYAWRNEKNIFKRKCDATGKEIISLFSPDAPCPVYESAYWYSDKWDAKKYGRDFDFSRGFFEQWGELKKVIPMPGKAISRIMENSDYSDNCSGLKNCYLCFNTGDSEDSLYSIDMWNSDNCVDCLGIFACHDCYELLDSRNCYDTHFSFDIKNCHNSSYLYDCDGCSDCYGCFGLENKQFYIYNACYSEKEYHSRVSRIKTHTQKEQHDCVQIFLQQSGYTGYRVKNLGSENIISSSRVFDSKNVSYSHIINNSEDIRYSKGLRYTRLAMDYDQWGDQVDKVYEGHQVGESANSVYFSVCVWANVSDVFYSAYCVDNVRNCFGCIGLREAEYCILNKQYTREEYNTFVPKIIEHMMERSEWGEFIPAKYSPFGYNQTMNIIKHPLSREEAKREGFIWSDYEAPFPKVKKIINARLLPEDITKIPDDILNWAIECEVTGKPFRIVKPELEFYRKHNLQIPHRHPDQRYIDRLKWYFNY